jgi:hypothetical protein
MWSGDGLVGHIKGHRRWPYASGQSRIVADGCLLSDMWETVLDSSAEVIEDYPEDVRGLNCLIYCEVFGVAEDVVIAFPSALEAQRRGYHALAFLVTCLLSWEGSARE